MGNCQATEAATVVIQQPGGKVEKLYWPTSAREVMRSHPGHYVALITLCLPDEQRRQPQHHQGGGGVRCTRVRLLRPKDTLLPGQVYRLVTPQAVTKALRAREQEKMRAAQMDLLMKQRQQQQQTTTTKVAADAEQGASERASVDPQSHLQVVKQERGRQKAAQPSPRQRQWRPSLQSISEAGN